MKTKQTQQKKEVQKPCSLCGFPLSSVKKHYIWQRHDLFKSVTSAPISVPFSSVPSMADAGVIKDKRQKEKDKSWLTQE